MKKYLKIWWILSLKSSQIAFSSRFGAFIFILGKILRFVLFLLFIFVITAKTSTIAGYTIWQVIFFFVTFNLVDTLSQLFLREVYRFRWYIVSGDFDYFLVKPLSPLFRSLFGGTDVLDISLLILSIILLVMSVGHIGTITPVGIILYLLLLINAWFLALSFHIVVLGICILTTEIDNTLWTYRDLIQLGRVPIDIYREPLRGFLTFVIPIGIMMTFPAKALMGLLSWQAILAALSLGILFFCSSLFFWEYALKKYTSASS